MKIGFLSDAHGNVKALENCLNTLTGMGAESIYFLGDAVGYLPGGNEVVDVLRSASVLCQKGNHESMVLGGLPLSSVKDRIYGIRAARETLTPVNLEFIRCWPDHRGLCIEGREMLLVHGSPDEPLTGYLYRESDFSFVGRYSCDCLFVGHTHHPFIAEHAGVLIVNVGSCGLPRDQGDLSAFALYDTEAHAAAIFRRRFDRYDLLKSFDADRLPKEVVHCLHRSTPAPFGTVIGRDIAYG